MQPSFYLHWVIQNKSINGGQKGHPIKTIHALSISNILGSAIQPMITLKKNFILSPVLCLLCLQYIKFKKILLCCELRFMPEVLMISCVTSHGPNTRQSTNWDQSIDLVGGLVGTVWFELPACCHQNLGIFWGVWLFQKFFCQQMYPTPVKSLFENTMGNPFFDFFKYWPKRSRKKFRFVII